MRRLDQQNELIDALDKKAAAILGLASALVPVWGGLLAVARQDVPSVVIALYGLAFLAYAFLLYFGFEGLRIKVWSLRPDMEQLKTYGRTKSELSVSVWVADESVRSIVKNDVLLKQKARQVDLAFIALVGLAVFLIVAS